MEHVKNAILITGAGGYLGSVCVGYFLEKGYHVVALDRFFFGEEVLNKYKSNPRLRILKEDTRYVSEDIFRNIDVVIDFAGLSNDPSADLDPRLTEEINFEGAVHVANLAKKAGVRKLLYASSCSVYGHGSEMKLTETSPVKPLSLYAKVKKRVEDVLFALADDTFIVTCARNATCYGLSPRMRFDLAVNIMTLHAFKNGRIIVQGGGRQWRPFIHVEDLVRAYGIIIEADSSLTQKEIFNVGSEAQNYQILQLAQIVKSKFPLIDINVISDDPDKRDYNVSFEKLKKVFNYEPLKTAEDGVIEIKQALENGNLVESAKMATVQYYKYLIMAENEIETLKYNGTLF